MYLFALILVLFLLCIVFLPRRVGHPLGWAGIGILFLAWGITGYSLPWDWANSCDQISAQSACLAFGLVVSTFDHFPRGGCLFGIALLAIALGDSGSRKPEAETPTGPSRIILLAFAGAAIATGLFIEATWFLQGTERDSLWHFALAGGGVLVAASLAFWPGMRAAVLTGAGVWLVLLAYSLWIYPSHVIAGAEKIANGLPYCVATAQSDASVATKADLSLLTHPKRRRLESQKYNTDSFYNSGATSLSLVFHDPSQADSASDGLAWAHWQPFLGWFVPELDRTHSGMWLTNCHLDANWAATLPRVSDMELTTQRVKYENDTRTRVVGRHVRTSEFTIPSEYRPIARGSTITLWVDGIDLMPLDDAEFEELLERPISDQTSIGIQWTTHTTYHLIWDFEQSLETGQDPDWAYPTVVAGCEDFCGIATLVDVGPVRPFFVSLTLSDAYKSMDDLGDWQAKAKELQSFAQTLITGPQGEDE